MSDPIIVDFETDPIVGNPYIKPPKPCGVSIQWPGYTGNYFAWGHPTNNNCTLYDGMNALDQALQSGLPLCFHHAGFDISVWASMHEHFRARLIDSLRQNWQRYHETQYLIFLNEPYAPTFSLKPSALRVLGIPADEQTELKNWILTNVPQATASDWGAWICKAPGDLVGKYANGDTFRTDKLFKHLYPIIVERGMLESYDRERRLFPVLFEGTKRGIRIDREPLIRDTEMYTQALNVCEARLCASIGITQHQLEDDEEALKDGLERSGAVKEWVLTPKSKKRSLAQGNLKIVDLSIRDLLDYRGALKTCLQTFMRPWIEYSREDGRIHPNWNQVRQAKGDYHSKGARTGRISSDDPSVMNIPTEWEYKDGTPMVVPPGLPAYPIVRSYTLPEAGHVWLKRDFSSQEVRILAHFEDGALQEAYQADPNMDPHQMARDMIENLIGLVLARRPVKITGFSIIYGTGAPGLSIQLERPIEEARSIKDAYLSVMPGIKALMQDVQLRGRSGLGIRTWGGRVYFSEPPKELRDENGNLLRVMRFDYKLLNYLIQGSAADQTKECVIDWDSDRGDGIFLTTVHDEINISAPKDTWKVHMSYLRRVMEKDRFSVPFKSEGLVGPNWGQLENCE